MFAILTIGSAEQRLNAYQLVSGAWELVTENFAGGATSKCNLDADTDGNIIAAYRDENLGGRTSVMKYENQSWSGIYFVKIIGEKGIQAVKLMKK